MERLRKYTKLPIASQVFSGAKPVNGATIQRYAPDGTALINQQTIASGLATPT